LVIENLKKDYNVGINENERIKIFSKKTTEIITYFNSEEGKKIRCYIKGYENKYVLLQ
jgi:hypothetical protein